MKALDGIGTLILAIFLGWLSYDIFMVALSYNRVFSWVLAILLAISCLTCMYISYLLMTEK